MHDELAYKLHAAFVKRKQTLALAESCTGGAMAQRLTAVPGASEFLLGSLVLYSNAWKHTFLGVLEQTLKTHGAVSLEVVHAMVEGLLHRTACDVALAVSGIAGPTGGTPSKPVGTVFVGFAHRGEPVVVERLLLHGDRSSVIAQTVDYGLRKLL